MGLLEGGKNVKVGGGGNNERNGGVCFAKLICLHVRVGGVKDGKGKGSVV